MNIGRYECPLCDKRFVYLSDKKSHIKLEHKQSAALIAKDSSQ